MKSPFPGMDPYLELHWLDVHLRLCAYACDALSPQLGQGLRARMGERLIIEHDGDPVRQVYPDVHVIQHGYTDRPIAPAAGVAVAEPLVVHVPTEEIRQPFVQIIDVRSGGRVITVIEFMSPTTKFPGDGQEKYLAKQRESKLAGVNVVEIDLTRGGRRQMLYPVVNLPGDYQTPCLACIWRSAMDRYEIYRMPLRDPLPAIRIPLREEDPDAVLNIQAIVDEAYAKGQYDDIDYARPSIPPLEGEDAAWAEELLRVAGKRA